MKDQDNKSIVEKATNDYKSGSYDPSPSTPSWTDYAVAIAVDCIGGGGVCTASLALESNNASSGFSDSEKMVYDEVYRHQSTKDS